MAIRSIKNLRNLRGKRVLVRMDFNVPVKNGKVLEDMRLVASLPTIHYLVSKKAKVVLLSHLGRPDGKQVSALSLAPIAKKLESLLKTPVTFVPEVVGSKVERAVLAMQPGDILLLENVRFSPNESGSMPVLAKQLAELGDVFVQECFAVAHRKSATISLLPRLLPQYAGLLFEKEITGLTRVTKAPPSPFVAIIGGAKLETKIPVINALLPTVDTILVGGGIVNTYLKAKGYGVGKSLFDEALTTTALAFGKKRKIVFPVDVVVGKTFGHHGRRVILGKHPHQICKTGEAILDIGPGTIRLYASYIKKAKTLLWNGAMGFFEQKPFDVGTRSVARLIASQTKRKAFGVIGGGETIQAMELVHMSEYVDLISTGGGAMLEFLAGKKLPGIEALKR